MPKPDFSSDFFKSLESSVSSIMDANGWKKGVINPEHLGQDAAFFYIHDAETSWIWCCSIPLSVLSTLEKQTQKHSVTEFSNLLGTLLIEFSKKPQLTETDENHLGMAVAGYITKTKTFLASHAAQKANHFFVIRYGSTSNIRPFVQSGPMRHLLPASDVESSFRYVIDLDAQNHPEWNPKKP